MIVSTPHGMNMFYKLWSDAENERNSYVPIEVHWSEIPGRDDNWVEEQFKLLGEVKFNQEVLCDFLGSTNTLISGKSLSTMSSTDPVYKKDGLDIYEEPQEDKYYVIAADTARGIGGDFSAFIVIDITAMPFKVVGKYRAVSYTHLTLPTNREV